MADNVTSNAGSGGPVWATDDIGGVHFPRFKIAHGADGSATDTSAANPLPVVVADVATAANQATGNAALATIAGHVDTLEAGQATGNASLAAIGTAVDGLEAATGDPADAAAAADGTGNYSLIGAAKRALLNWATLLARVPAPVTPGLLPVDTLASLGVARQLAAGAASSASVALTSRRVSLHANGAAIRISVGTGAQTATATSHFIASGERLDISVPASAQIAVIRAGSTDGVLELSELV